MVTARHNRTLRTALARRSAAQIWRPRRKALAELLRGMATDLSVAYAVCVTVQAALRYQDADEDRELELCLRTQVADAISRHVDKLRSFAQQLAPATLTSQE